MNKTKSTAILLPALAAATATVICGFVLRKTIRRTQKKAKDAEESEKDDPIEMVSCTERKADNLSVSSRPPLAQTETFITAVQATPEAAVTRIEPLASVNCRQNTEALLKSSHDTHKEVLDVEENTVQKQNEPLNLSQTHMSSSSEADHRPDDTHALFILSGDVVADSPGHNTVEVPLSRFVGAESSSPTVFVDSDSTRSSDSLVLNAGELLVSSLQPSKDGTPDAVTASKAITASFSPGSAPPRSSNASRRGGRRGRTRGGRGDGRGRARVGRRKRGGRRNGGEGGSPGGNRERGQGRERLQ